MNSLSGYAEARRCARRPRSLLLIESRCPLAYFAEANASAAACSFAAARAPLAAFSMRRATACGCDTYTARPLTSTTVEPARLDIARWASGGISLSSIETKYQLGLFATPAG